MQASTLSGFNFAPWRLSGTVYGTLLNDAAALAAIGDAANNAPYKAPKRWPTRTPPCSRNTERWCRCVT